MGAVLYCETHLGLKANEPLSFFRSSLALRLHADAAG